MATFPDGIFSPRSLVNRPGTSYETAASPRIFAEDFNLPQAEIVAIENYLKNYDAFGYNLFFQLLACPNIDQENISLNEQQIVKMFPIAHLVNLTVLDISYNNLTSFILPPSLVHLTSFNIGGNGIDTLTIPAALDQLSFLNAESNSLTTITIPPELTLLNEIYFSNNPMTSAFLPSTFTNIANVYFDGCSLDQESVDGILDVLDTCGVENGYLHLEGGNNAVPTDGASNVDLVSLQSKGWTVLINS